MVSWDFLDWMEMGGNEFVVQWILGWNLAGCWIGDSTRNADLNSKWTDERFGRSRQPRIMFRLIGEHWPTFRYRTGFLASSSMR
jgi:hypothetical protein